MQSKAWAVSDRKKQQFITDICRFQPQISKSITETGNSLLFTEWIAQAEEIICSFTGQFESIVWLKSTVL